MQEVTANCNEMDWEPAENYPSGTLKKTLRDFEGNITLLIKMPPGFKLDAHCHTKVEQHYVLEGQYEVEGQVYGPGTYQMLPPHFTHGPFISKNGAIVLVIWDEK